MRKIELLAPVGKLENAYAAIENGADAIFVGGKLFNARHSAENFDDEALETIVKYCKLRAVKVYVTVNTLVKNVELPALFEYLKTLATLNVDAIIIQDLGVAALAKRYFPTLTRHASTQMTAHSLEDVLFLKEEGFKRIVLAREMQLEDIRQIKAKTDIELETFIHGALCYAYSGQCLMSSLIGGRSGNRGKCAQSCRMQYSLLKGSDILKDNLYMLSPKDIYTLPFLPQLIEAGIDSFKVEGRLKSPEYVASVIKAYRQHIDLALENPENYKVDTQALEDMQSIFNRGGFSTGYYMQKAGLEMMTEKTPKNIGLPIGKICDYDPRTKQATCYTTKDLYPGDGLEIWNSKAHIGTGIEKHYKAHSTFKITLKDPAEKNAAIYRSKAHQLLKTLRTTYQKANKKIPITMVIKGELYKPLELHLAYETHQVCVLGETIMPAENKPLLAEEVKKQLSKLGNTSFTATHIDLMWPEHAFMPISQLNALRREAVLALEKALLESPHELTPLAYEFPTLPSSSEPITYSAKVRTLEQLEACLKEEQLTRIYWEWQYNCPLSEVALALCRKAQKAFYLVLPAIMKDSLWQTYRQALIKWDQRPIAGYLVRTYGQMHHLAHSTKEKILDYTLNVFNQEAINAWVEEGVAAITPSLELSKDELSTLKGPLEKLLYGYYPVMTTDQCLLGHYQQCQKMKKEENFSLKDRKAVTWPLLTDCVGCKMQILSHTPLFTARAPQELMYISRYRLDFTIETSKEVSQVLDTLFARKDQLPFVTQVGSYLKGIQ